MFADSTWTSYFSKPGPLTVFTGQAKEKAPKKGTGKMQQGSWMLLRCQKGTRKIIDELDDVKAIGDLARVLILSLQRRTEVQLWRRGENKRWKRGVRDNRWLFFLINLFYLFIYYFWLCWVFVAAFGLSLVAASGGYFSLQCSGFALQWLLLLRSTGSRCVGFSSCGSRALERRLSSCDPWA